MMLSNSRSGSFVDGLLFKYVESGPGNALLLQSVGERLLVDNWTSRYVD